MDMVGFEEIYLIVGERKEPIDYTGDMMCHEVEGAGDVQTQPSDLYATFVAKDSKLPKIVGG
jgi:hypothetical protein